MRVLIVGCGYVGLPLGQELVKQGHEVYGLRRSSDVVDELKAAGITPLQADITKPETLASLPRNLDWVINCAASGGLNGQYVLNPTLTQLKETQLNLVVAGTRQAVLMVESEAMQLSEDVMLGAVVYGHEQMQAVINMINELADEAGKPLWDWVAPEKDTALADRVRQAAEQPLREAYQIKQKQARTARIDEIYAGIEAELTTDETESPSGDIADVLGSLEKEIVRGQILSGEPRIDGRDTRTVRPIAIRTGLLPRAHGSALFTRGETQSMAVATLGTARDEQIIDALQGEYKENFMLHYNMPPYATGETGRVGTPKRREVGHGRLAKRALLAVLPSPEEFGYSLRVVSEITESNGSRHLSV